MDNRNQTPFQPMYQKSGGSKLVPALIAAVVVLAAAGLVVAKQHQWWPFATETPVVQATPTPSPTGVQYRNDQYGFSIALTDKWHGYTIDAGHWDGSIYDAKATPTGSDQGPQIVLHYPGSSTTNPHEAMPIMVFTPAQWNLVQAGQADPPKAFMSVDAAPFPPSELGHNSKYILALPPRYNYDYQPGWEEVDQLVHTLQAFEPASSTSTSKTYTNTHYGFQLTLTDAWNGYKVFSSSGSQGVGNPQNFEFAMPTSDRTKCVMSVTDQVCGYADLMDITVFAKDIWDQMTPAQKNGLHIIGQNTSIVILGSVAPGTLPSDLKNGNFTIPQILSTFKFTK